MQPNRFTVYLASLTSGQRDMLLARWETPWKFPDNGGAYPTNSELAELRAFVAADTAARRS